MAITPFVAGWRESTSVVFHDQLPVNKNIVRNPLHTILQTGLYARYRITVGNFILSWGWGSRRYGSCYGEVTGMFRGFKPSRHVEMGWKIPMTSLQHQQARLRWGKGKSAIGDGWPTNEATLHFAVYLENYQRYLHDFVHTSRIVYCICILTSGLVNWFRTVAPSGEYWPSRIFHPCGLFVWPYAANETKFCDLVR